MFSEPVDRHNTLYQVYEYGQLESMSDSARWGRGGNDFDGVTCRNEHLVAQLDSRLLPKQMFSTKQLKFNFDIKEESNDYVFSFWLRVKDAKDTDQLELLQLWNSDAR